SAALRTLLSFPTRRSSDLLRILDLFLRIGAVQGAVPAAPGPGTAATDRSTATGERSRAGLSHLAGRISQPDHRALRRGPWHGGYGGLRAGVSGRLSRAFRPAFGGGGYAACVGAERRTSVGHELLPAHLRPGEPPALQALPSGYAAGAVGHVADPGESGVAGAGRVSFPCP